MDPLSIATATASLLAASFKLSHGLIVLRSKFERVPETVSNLCSELQLTSVGLNGLQNLLRSRPEALTSTAQDDPTRHHLLQCVDATTVSMAKSFSVLDTEIGKLNKDESAESRSIAWRLRFMWVESDLGTLMTQVRDQRSSLNFLMQVVQTAKIDEIHQQFQAASPGLAALRRTATVAKGSNRPAVRPSQSQDQETSSESCTPELQKILEQNTRFPDLEDISQPAPVSNTPGLSTAATEAEDQKPKSQNIPPASSNNSASDVPQQQSTQPVPSSSTFPAEPYTPSAKVQPTLVYHELHYAVTNNDIGRVPLLLDAKHDPLGLPSNPYGTLPNASKTSLSLAAYLGRDEILSEFLQRGFGWAVNECIGKDLPPLLAAAYAGREKAARILLSNGANPRLRGYGNQTSLFWASARGHTNIVQLLFESGAADDINFADDKGLSPLMVAAQHGRDGVVEALLARGADIHAVNGKGQSALHLASHAGHLDIVQMLLSRGASLNSPTTNGKTPLIFAASAGFADVVDLLAASGAFVNLQDSSDCTALYYAAKGGHSAAAEVLLDRYAATELVTKAGDRALHAACQGGHARVVGLLLEHGARLDAARTSDGLSALNVAAWHRHRDVLAPLVLFRAEQDPAGFSTRDALYAAAEWGLADVVDALLEAGADLNDAEENEAESGPGVGGQTLLARACREGKVDAARLLIGKRADVNKVDCYGATPLHRVAMAANVRLATLLIEAGARLDCTDKNDRTPAQVAEVFGSQAMRDYFRSYRPA